MEEPRPALGTETFDRLHDLIPFCVREILLVSSLYDSFILGEDLQLTEQLLNSFQDMGLSYPPRVTRVDNAERALQALKERPFDMVLATMRLGGMAPVPFAQEVKRRHPNLPVILLAYSTAALPPSPERQALPGIDKVFVWSGDSGILLSIVKFVEDRLNADHDTRGGKVRVLILVENSARYYSSFLPLIYSEIVRHTVALLSESFNPMQKRLRMRARPKILLAETYEEGLALYLRYRSYVLGILSDVRFPREQRLDPKAGFRLVEEIWRHDPVLPILLQSSARENEAHARALGLPFLNKTSPTLLQDLRSFLLTDLGFGEFTFRAGDGRTFGSAATASDLLRLMREVPDESLSHHAERHHFSNWFYARGEFELADALRSRRRGDFKAPTDLRDFIVRTIHPFAEAPATSDPDEAPGGSIGAERFSRVGGGSMGGKARGMAFLGTLLAQNRLATSVPGAILSVPRSMVIGTDAFDEFLRQNPLREAALEGAPDAQTAAAFVRAPLPESVASQIARFLEREHRPLAVRSSSLLEDSQELPLAGIYATYMLPNNHPDLRVRMGQLCTAVRLVYASTFTQKARRYLEAAPYRVEEEKMAVMVQRLVGRQHGRYFYPDISGVAQSYNFYPFGPVRPEDGCAQVALGLGKAVVSGGDALRFCPKAPRVVPQLASPEVALRTTQRAFYALDLGEPRLRVYEEANLVELGLEVAEEHGVLDLLGGVYSEEDGVIRDGLQRPGQRLVTFGQVLRWDEYPLSRVLDEILRIGQEGMGCPVEIEFAASRPSQPGAPMEFSFLQLRPLAAAEREVSVSVDAPGADALCGSRLALGHGRLQGLCDVVYVSPARLDRSRTAEVAQEVGALNDRMARSRIPYVLIGPGRWGSTDPSLGIPVGWEQICGAKLIVETPLQGIEVEPSQGSHFFHNLTAMRIGYLTTGATRAEGAVDWAWLDRQNAVQENGSVRHVRLDGSLDIRIDGRTRRAVVLKPGVGGAEDNLVEAEP